MRNLEINKITVIGAGLMGHGIAEVAALSGVKVDLDDAYPEALEKGKAGIQKSLARLVKSGKLSQEESDNVFGRITFLSDLGESVKDSDMIIEAVPEIPDLKIKLLKEVSDSCRKDAIIASNTSNIKISTISQNVENPERVLGLHFFNPPVLLKLVEVIKSEKTSDEAFETAFQFAKRIGKTPIRVMKDTPGFVVNRINAPESLLFCHILDKGLAKPEEVDAFGRSQGLPMGPYELMDYVGIDTVVHSLRYYAEALDPEYGSCKYFEKFMDSKELGLKTGKGFYVWDNGKAQIPKAEPSTALDLMDVLCVEINEAVKIVEEGIAEPSDIETGVKLGMNRPFGPISVAEGLTNAEIKRKLQKLSEKFGTKIFYPAKSIDEGKLREILSGKPKAPKEEPKKAASEGAPQQAQPTEGEPVTLSRDVEKKVATLTITNTRNNLINVDVLAGLEKHLKELWNDKEINVVVVRGSGKNLSAGAQLTQFFSSPMDFAENARLGERTFRLLSEIPKITIAEMKGNVFGGGFELAAWCDIRVATPDARMGLPEVTLGLVPGWGGSQRLAKLLGMSRATYLILTGERYEGKYAHEIGLVSKLFPAESVESETDKMAADLADRIAPISAAIAKGLINKGSDVPADNGLHMESMAMGLLYGTEDLKEGISAFLGKRKPEYKGR